MDANPSNDAACKNQAVVTGHPKTTGPKSQAGNYLQCWFHRRMTKDTLGIQQPPKTMDMKQTTNLGQANYMVTAAALIIVIAGLRLSVDIVVPFLLAIFLTIICSPPLIWLKSKGLSTGLAMLLIISGILLLGLIMVSLIGSSLDEFSSKASEYSARIKSLTLSTLTFLENKGVDLPEKKLVQYIDPAEAFGNAFLIFFTVVFMLYEAADFPNKLNVALKNPEASIPRFKMIMQNVNQYLVIKTLTSLATGVLIALWLSILGVDFPILWGVLAFFLNFIPNIGSILAAIPAVLIALVQLGLDFALWATLGFLVVNTLIGTVIEPRFLGKGLGLSTLVVFVSLVFWGWVFGPIGMFLSVLLTMTLKIAVENNPKTQWISVLMGPPLPKTPAPEVDEQKGSA
ncbi:AI-2E family transporter [Pseudomonadota bacterium]